MISVLYVDDEELLLDIGKKFLERLGNFEVTLQDSAVRALELLKSRQFDAIISDYQMPEIDGIAFLQEVRRRYGHTPFILFTGRGREEVVIRALNEGADFYLQKGGDPKSQFTELIHKISLSVQRRETEKALAESERRYREVVETQIEFIARFSPEWNLVFVNEAYCRYLGKKREDLLGKRYVPDIPLEDRAWVYEQLSSLSPKQPVNEIEHRIRMPDGSIRWHWWNNRALFDDTGTLLEYQSVGTDITERKLAEEALKEREHRLQTVGQNIPGAIYQFELSKSGVSRFPYIKGNWEGLFGVSAEETLISPERAFAAISPDDLPLVNQTIAESARSLTPWSCEFRTIIHGSVKWLLGRSVPECNPGDQSTLWNGVLMDITEQKIAQAALVESEEKFRVLAENAPAGITVIQGNADVYVNDYAVMMTGYQKEDFYRTNFWDFIHPDHRELIQKRAVDRLRGLPVPKRYEIKYLTRDGVTRWVDLSVDKLMYQGKPALISMMVDITDRKHAEEELQAANEELIAAHEELQAQLIELRDQQYRLSESEQNYRTILENIQDVYFRTDRDGNLLLASPSFAKVLGYDSVTELYGKNLANILYANPEQRNALLDKISQNGFVTNYEVVIKKKDGSPVYVLSSSQIYYSATGEASGVEGIFRDITERKKMEDALRESESLYRSVFDNTGAGTIIIGKDTTILLANTSWEKLTGIPRSEQENIRSWTDFVSGPDLERMKNYHHARRIDPDSAPRVYECTIFDVDKCPHTCVIYVDLIPGSENSVASLIDISGLKKAESALYESEEKYRSIIERMQDPFYRTDLQGHLIMVNPAFGKTFGYQGSDELIGKSITDTLYANPYQRDELIQQLSRDGEVREFRLTLKRHDGTEGTYTASSHLIYDDAKQPIGVEGLFHDITDHLKVEEAYAEIESKYHELSELLPQMVFEMNPQCQITYANRYALDSMGYTHEDIQDGLDIYAVIDPKDHARLKEMIENPSRNPPPGTHEYLGRKKDGITTPILVYLTAVFRNRSVAGYCGVIIDISERKKMELDLIQKEELFREVFHNASDEIILHEISQENGPGPLILVNDITCEKLGYSREELLKLSLHDILPDVSVKNTPNISKQLFSNKKVVFESGHRKKDGTIYPVEVNSHLFYLNGTPVTLSISRDITERKRAEEALRQANNKLNILSSITRHDLLNQLNALILFLELSKKQIHEDPLALTYLEKELEITQIMHHQIGFTKSYQDIGVKKPEWTSVNTLLLQAAKHLGIQDSTLHISLSGLKIYADRLVVKVYYNLLENSIRHGGKISRISVSSHQTEVGMVIEYRDDGVGIPEENKELIFTKGFGSNTGWGMFLSREILSITNISIRETGTLGKGVRFEIEIPNGHWSLAPDPYPSTHQ